MELINLILKSDISAIKNLQTETLVEVFKQLDYSNNLHKKYILEIIKIIISRKHLDFLMYNSQSKIND